MLQECSTDGRQVGSWSFWNRTVLTSAINILMYLSFCSWTTPLLFVRRCFYVLLKQVPCLFEILEITDAMSQMLLLYVTFDCGIFSLSFEFGWRALFVYMYRYVCMAFGEQSCRMPPNIPVSDRKSTTCAIGCPFCAVNIQPRNAYLLYIICVWLSWNGVCICQSFFLPQPREVQICILTYVLIYLMRGWEMGLEWVFFFRLFVKGI